MIRRSARGVRESMRYGLAFYELDGPLFALESGRRHMSLFVAEQEVVVRHKDILTGVDVKRSFVRFSDLNRLPLDVVEKIVRDSVAARRTRLAQGTVPTQADLLKLWDIKEEKAAPPPGKQVISLKPTAAELAAQATAMANAAGNSMAMVAAATTKMVSAMVRQATQATQAAMMPAAKPARPSASKMPAAKKAAPARPTAKQVAAKKPVAAKKTVKKAVVAKKAAAAKKPAKKVATKAAARRK
jgi:hypothetical protein